MVGWLVFNGTNRLYHAKAAEGGLGWGQNHRGSGMGVPQRGPGRSPGRGSGDEIPQKLKKF